MSEKSLLSKTQLGLYLECDQYPERTTYNMPFLCALKKETDVSRFKSAVEAVLDKHPALSSHLVEESGQVYMEKRHDNRLKEYRLSDEAF